MSDPRDPNVDALTDGEMALLKKLLGNWLVIPDSFKVASADYAAQNSTLPISQVQGFTQFVAQQDVVASSDTTTSTTYADLTHTGPTLSGLGRGKYIFFYGMQAAALDVGNVAQAHVFVNGSDLGDSYGIYGGGLAVSIARAFVYDLTENSNTVVMKYSSFTSGKTAGVSNRWIVSLRIANL